MSIEVEITRLVGAKDKLRTWLNDQGVAAPDSALLGDLVALLDRVKVENTSLAAIKSQPANVMNGEIVVPGVIIDERDIADFFLGCIAYRTAAPARLLVLTPNLGQYICSSGSISIATRTNCTRIADQTLFWNIDPDMVAFSQGETLDTIAFWG